MIGGGGMTREHIRAFQDIPGVTIAGIWNRTRNKAEALASEFAIAYVADSIDDLYTVTKADLAILAVYETAINPVMKMALAHPWAILMEKPIGLDLADAEDIAAAARAAKAQVYVGLNRRTLSSTVAVLADLADDQGPRFVHVQDQQSLDTARLIGHAQPVVDNWMYANSIHLVDYIPALCRGNIVEVVPVVRWDSAAPTVVIAKVAFDSGDIAVYEGIWNGPGPWACTVTTPRRRWEMRPLEKASFQNAGERVQNIVEPHERDNQFKPGFRLQAENVVAALRGTGSATTLDEGLRSMRLVHDIFADARERCRP
ncbi:Gfo/Idh/MocA family oxidoreductase [Tardiphaga sp. 866_E4_N2_1]|uniref:Gfo/Idh/MocA family oxidoreductase n=1 Tax=unclassified Tardiphaga TaxID=2631404 RepID=UPI003F2118C6